MGLFWEYFRDKLRFPPIQRPGGPLAALAEGGATSLDATRNIMLQLREQFFPEKCEEALLSRFARSRGIVRAPLETEAHYQARVRFAYLWWVRGGRASSMAQSLVKFFGFAGARILSLRAEHPERWAEFRVELDVAGSDLQVSYEQVEWAVNEAKPARSRLAEILMTYSVSGAVPVLALSMQSSEVITVYPG
jgi:hypothetical protein